MVGSESDMRIRRISGYTPAMLAMIDPYLLDLPRKFKQTAFIMAHAIAAVKAPRLVRSAAEVETKAARSRVAIVHGWGDAISFYEEHRQEIDLDLSQTIRRKRSLKRLHFVIEHMLYSSKELATMIKEHEMDEMHEIREISDLGLRSFLSYTFKLDFKSEETTEFLRLMRRVLFGRLKQDRSNSGDTG